MQLLDSINGATFDKAQDAIVAEFNSLGDVFGQYTYLVELSAQLPSFTEEEKQESALVDKCQSQVWIRARALPNDESLESHPRLSLDMESDTLIVRGMLLLMRALFHGRTLEEVDAAKVTFVDRTELKDAFSDERLNGFQAIERTIKALAREALDC